VRVVVTERARADLARLIQTHSLPASTRDRVRRALAPLAEFPLLGPPLHGRWAPMRFILGPWRWMVVVHEVDRERGLVLVLAIVDGRSAASPTVLRED
jgi:plasmid stabilization system protein ParE